MARRGAHAGNGSHTIVVAFPKTRCTLAVAGRRFHAVAVKCISYPCQVLNVLLSYLAVGFALTDSQRDSSFRAALTDNHKIRFTLCDVRG